MPTFPLMQVDAFTNQPLGGNPCAVVFDADELDDDTMQAIAREMNLSETAFVTESPNADFGVRYFTPAEEIPMAGHPTIATTFALVESGRLTPIGDLTTITLMMRVGQIQVEIFSEENVPQLVVMTQQKPKFMQIYDPADVMHAFGLWEDDVLPDYPIQTVSTGTPQLMIPVRDIEVLTRIQVDVAAYTILRNQGDFFSPHLFCTQGITSEGRTFARHFGVPPDVPEDPFTGSATGGMASYLWHYGLIDEPVFTAEQGHWMKRPGQGTVEVIGSRDDIEAVKVGGEAVTVMVGELRI